MYAVYHGPRGLRAIAERVNLMARILALGLDKLGHPCLHDIFSIRLCSRLR